MTDRELYAVAIPSAAQTDSGATARINQATQGILDSSTGYVDPIAPEPNEQSLTVQYRGTYSEIKATQLDELARGEGISEIPYHGITTSTPQDGYYTLSQANVGRADPRTDTINDFRGTLTRVGSKADYWRAVETSISQVDHPFGNDTEAFVGVDTRASKVRWLNPDTGDTEEPTVQATRNAEFGDIDVYDARNSTFYDASTNDYPTLIFEIDYDDEGWTDPRIWDDRGNSSRSDGDGTIQWAKVFATDHDFNGKAVLSTGIIRLFFDEGNNALTAETWDDANSTWSSVSLGASDWELFDVDVRHIGLSRVAARVEFRDTTQSPTAYYKIDARLSRGDDAVLWAEVSGEGATPTGLETKLDPIAATQIYDANEAQTLVNRTEV